MEQPWYRLEVCATTRRRVGGLTGYGFALLERDSGRLVATGCGCVSPDVTFPQAAHIALVEGLQAAQVEGVTRLELVCDAGAVVRQLLHHLPERGPVGQQSGRQQLPEELQQQEEGLQRRRRRRQQPQQEQQEQQHPQPEMQQQSQPETQPRLSSPLAAALHLINQQLQEVAVQQVDRWSNGLAIIQAEFATELLLLLPQVASAPPSKFAQVAGRLGLLLQLPMSVRRLVEAADDFTAAVAQLVAVRCGTDKQLVIQAALSSRSSSSMGSLDEAGHSSSADTVAGGDSDGSADACEGADSISSPSVAARCAAAATIPELVLQLVPFPMRRVFTAQEGNAYASAAAAAAAGATGAGAAEAGADAAAASRHAEQQLAAAGLSRAAPEGAGSHRLLGGRVIGRHRLTHRPLVVGFSPLLDWEEQLVSPGHEQQQQQQQQAADTAAAAGSGQHQQQPPQSAADEAASAADAAVGVAADADLLLSSWMVGSRAASSSEGAGLGEGRYSLPAVSSDMATHLLQFDGASRNNPGRAGFGHVLFDLNSGRLVSRACMSLPYGVSSGRAEFEGLNAGLQAALDTGVTHLAVQGDSAVVLDAIMFRRGLGNKELAMLYHKATQLLMRFQHVDFQYVPREQNSLADRLAQMSMDIDTALYVIMRKDLRGLDALRYITKAARIVKKTHMLELLLSAYSLPLLLVVLLERVMSLSPQALLGRLSDKAAGMGDPNPWLVQEVQKLVQEGIPDQVKLRVAAVVMDSRYKAQEMARLKKDLAAQPAAHQQEQQLSEVQQAAQALPAGQVGSMLTGGLNRAFSTAAHLAAPASRSLPHGSLHPLNTTIVQPAVSQLRALRVAVCMLRRLAR